MAERRRQRPIGVAEALRHGPRGRPSCRSGCASGTARWPARRAHRRSSSGRGAALRRLVWAPGELGLARAYVAGELDVEGDLATAFAALSSAGRLAPGDESAGPSLARAAGRCCGTAARLGVLGPNPAPPPEEVRLTGAGRPHSRAGTPPPSPTTTTSATTSTGWCSGPSMVYSCAVWDDEDAGLDAAQEAKLDLVCRKLGLQPGSRLLDVGCGWGSLAMHAAAALRRRGRRHHAVGSSRRALARKRVAEAGLTERVDIRVQDYREVDRRPLRRDQLGGHGRARRARRSCRCTWRHLTALLRPGGRLLNHAIAWNAGETTWEHDSFIARYVFPDGELISLGDMVRRPRVRRAWRCSTSRRCAGTTR